MFIPISFTYPELYSLSSTPTSPMLSDNGFHKPVILCDFDNTISLCDVTDKLLQRFGMSGYEQLENDWLAGKIGSQVCMSGQIELLNASLTELNDCLEEIDIDPYFKQFSEMAQKQDIALHIISDGLDYAIHFILQRHGLGSIPVFANRLIHMGERNWTLDFPYMDPKCKKRSGHCKCIHTNEKSNISRHIIYVGDGASDYCVSHHADWVLAKNSLINYCQKNRINHSPIASFKEACQLLPDLLPEIFLPVTQLAVLV